MLLAPGLRPAGGLGWPDWDTVSAENREMNWGLGWPGHESPFSPLGTSESLEVVWEQGPGTRVRRASLGLGQSSC